MKRMCFPSDFSELSLKSLPFVIGMAKKHDAEIYLIHVIGHWSGMYASAEREEVLSGVAKKFDEIKTILQKDTSGLVVNTHVSENDSQLATRD
jgi:hypothetical protein